MSGTLKLRQAGCLQPGQHDLMNTRGGGRSSAWGHCPASASAQGPRTDLCSGSPPVGAVSIDCCRTHVSGLRSSAGGPHWDQGPWHAPGLSAAGISRTPPCAELQGQELTWAFFTGATGSQWDYFGQISAHYREVPRENTPMAWSWFALFAGAGKRRTLHYTLLHLGTGPPPASFLQTTSARRG